MPPTNDEKRTLTDADIAEILAQAEKRFYSNLGKGVWAFVWKTLVLGLMAIAAAGYMKGVK
jgi:hypothetical protein